MQLRTATVEDIPVLVSHRRRMFEDMAARKGVPYDPSHLDAMDAAYGPYLHVQLNNATTRAWVIVDGDRKVASGALLFADWMPRPDGQKPGLAYVHSVYTEPDYRRSGLARRILKAMIAECRTRGLPRLTLHASEMGRPLYASLGFVDTNEMRLMLE